MNLLSELQKELGLTYLFIAHDLAAVRHISDRVAVMYGGRIVEMAEAKELYANPAHPYTVGLMASIPGIEGDAGTRLIAIDGQPPDLASLPTGCAFAPRCQHAHEACRGRIPGLEPVLQTPSHRSACIGYPE